jgi:hypothetical protein
MLGRFVVATCEFCIGETACGPGRRAACGLVLVLLQPARMVARAASAAAETLARFQVVIGLLRAGDLAGPAN